MKKKKCQNCELEKEFEDSSTLCEECREYEIEFEEIEYGGES